MEDKKQENKTINIDNYCKYKPKQKTTTWDHVKTLIKKDKDKNK